MLRQYWLTAFLGLAVTACTVSPVHGAFILTIDDSPNYTANSSGSVSVYIRSTEVLGESFGSFNVGIAFSIAGILDDTPLITNQLFPNTTNFGSGGGADYLIAGDIVPGNTTVFDSDIKLFDLNFVLGPGVADGAYPLVFVDGFNEVASGNGTILNIQSLNPGTLNVQSGVSVPEPNSLALLAIGTMGCAGCRRKRH